MAREANSSHSDHDVTFRKTINYVKLIEINKVAPKQGRYANVRNGSMPPINDKLCKILEAKTLYNKVPAYVAGLPAVTTPQAADVSKNNGSVSTLLASVARRRSKSSLL